MPSSTLAVAPASSCEMPPAPRPYVACSRCVARCCVVYHVPATTHTAMYHQNGAPKPASDERWSAGVCGSRRACLERRASTSAGLTRLVLCTTRRAVERSTMAYRAQAAKEKAASEAAVRKGRRGEMAYRRCDDQPAAKEACHAQRQLVSSLRRE